jgi:hypothetical protein
MAGQPVSAGAPMKQAPTPAPKSTPATPKPIAEWKDAQGKTHYGYGGVIQSPIKTTPSPIRNLPTPTPTNPISNLKPAGPGGLQPVLEKSTQPALFAAAQSTRPGLVAGNASTVNTLLSSKSSLLGSLTKKL